MSPRKWSAKVFRVPLLIGGATTSRAHTAVKIAQHYGSSVVHVLDASRAVGVVNSLLNEELKGDFDARTRSDYAALREAHSARSKDRKTLTLEQARANRTPFDWQNYEPAKPDFTGLRTYSSAQEHASNRPITLQTLVPYIDWSPFFHTWELRGRYPAIFEDPVVGEQARELFADAQKLLESDCFRTTAHGARRLRLVACECCRRRRGNLRGRFARGTTRDIPFSSPANAEARSGSLIVASRIS